MAFGFVVEKFSLFLKYLAHYLVQTPPPGHPLFSMPLGALAIHPSWE